MRTIKARSASTYVWKLTHLNRSRIAIFITLFILATMLFVINIKPYGSFGLAMIPISYVLGIYAYRSYSLWASGIAGERMVLKELKKLGDEYVLIRNAVIPPSRGDTDYIVIGPTGLFVAETKNVGGIVSCNGDDWSRHKVGRGGTTYQLAIGNPGRQAKRSAKTLKDFILMKSGHIFRGKAPHLWVYSILVFTNRDVRLSLKNTTVHVLDVCEINDFILKQRGIRLSKDAVDGIANAVAGRF